MKRRAQTFLQTWLTAKSRKPLILRGARQTGKTWLVRELAQQNNLQLLELNFERDPTQAKYFSSNDTGEILKLLSTAYGKKISIENSLLFLDEIQAAPELIAKLRWFAEDLPSLRVIAAGSLLEFALAEHSFSMPVGRVNFAHLEPLSFEEFLLAYNKEQLVEYLSMWKIGNEIPDPLHRQLTLLFQEYIIIGGMPAAVASWISEQSPEAISQIHQNLLGAYRSDFSKYSGRLNPERLEEVLSGVPRLLGQKFVYSQINPDIHTEPLKTATHLLNQARVCHRVQSTAANGVPLASQSRDKFFKEIFIDVGLASSLLHMNLNYVRVLDELTFINSGALAEQVAGQLLRTIEPFYIEPKLYYWHNDTKGSQAELDYILQHGPSVVPIEVKAGATGSLKSLHLFMQAKKLKQAVRIFSGLPGQVKQNFHLISLPFYLVGQLHRLLDESMPL